MSSKRKNKWRYEGFFCCCWSSAPKYTRSFDKCLFLLVFCFFSIKYLRFSFALNKKWIKIRKSLQNNALFHSFLQGFHQQICNRSSSLQKTEDAKSCFVQPILTTCTVFWMLSCSRFTQLILMSLQFWVRAGSSLRMDLQPVLFVFAFHPSSQLLSALHRCFKDAVSVLLTSARLTLEKVSFNSLWKIK